VSFPHELRSLSLASAKAAPAKLRDELAVNTRHLLLLLCREDESSVAGVQIV
jgi:hypothetical protein